MVKHRYTNLVCIAVAIVMLALTCVYVFGESLGITAEASEMPYVEKLFSTDRVHTLDIVVNDGDWQSILDNASAKEYIPCDVVIDGDAVSSVGIRAKGNSSLSTIASSDSDRYSFKIEFDHYSNGKNYYGLDKLALNNIAQDSTYLKDYLSYQMMVYFGADSPLCSFIWITVNGEDWGLYLAVEGVEESFAQRNYGTDYGKIYKPDSMDMNGGGMGGGNRDENAGAFEMPDEMRDMMEQMENGEMPDFAAMFDGGEGGEMPQMPTRGAEGGGRGGMGGGMGGNSDVALVYTDDEYDSYSNIFDEATLDITDADRDRLIASLKKLNEGEDLESIVNIDEVLRYFVVHNFVLNFDSYTGSMTHNYYLYEEDGQLSMIAWDYNLAFGAFSMGGGMGGWGDGGSASSLDSATTNANFPIDTPVSGATLEDRPMLSWIFSDETYLEQYHALFDTFIADYFESGLFAEEYDRVVALIAPYVEKDPTAFCTYEEFETATENLRAFILLRAESVRGQLDGAIPSTSEGQAEDSSAFVDASSVDMQAMGNMNNGFNRARGSMMRTSASGAAAGEENNAQAPPEGMQPPDGMQFSEDMQPPDGMPTPPENGETPAAEAATVAENTEEGTSGETAPAEESRTSFQGPGGGMGGMFPGSESVQQQDNSARNYWLLGLAVLVMAIGLLFAKLFKR